MLFSNETTPVVLQRISKPTFIWSWSKASEIVKLFTQKFQKWLSFQVIQNFLLSTTEQNKNAKEKPDVK